MSATHLRHWTALLAVTGLLCTVLLATPGQAAAPVAPEPDRDRFYAVPSSVKSAKNGQVLASRRITPYALALPIPAHAWQIKYKTTDQHGKPSAYVATVLVPRARWTGKGPRPLVSYQVAEDAVGRRCTPSYALRAGVKAPLSGNAALETSLIASAVQRGFAVVVPDYQGPRSEFTGARGYAHGVLDAIRAARRLKAAGISTKAKIGLIGYSGGSIATNAAIQARAFYAPELRFAGAASGGTVADVWNTVATFSGGPTGGAIVVVMIGLDRSYPGTRFKQYLNRSGRQAMARSQTDCLADGMAKHPFASWERYIARPGVLNDPGFRSVFDKSSPLNFPGKPDTPVLFYHSVIDQSAPIADMRKLAAQYCRQGVPVRRHETILGEHVVQVVQGSSTAYDYLADRFAGVPAPDDC